MLSKLYSNVKQANFNFFSCVLSTNCPERCHYDILKLDKKCTQAEIRNSYLQLSKEYHPDKNKNDTHSEFLKISEAYRVLSKPSSRYEYDIGLNNPGFRKFNSGTWPDHTFWEHRDTSKDSFYESKPYYGIKGVKRVSNSLIVLLCMAFTTTGAILQYFAIRKSFTLKRDDMDKRSAELEQLHSELRARAIQNGNKKQLEIIKGRFVM